MSKSHANKNGGGRVRRHRVDPQPTQEPQPSWRVWAGLGYSILTSLIWVVVVAGLVLSTIVGLSATGSNVVRLPSPLGYLVLLSVALIVGGIALLSVVAIAARWLGIPRAAPLVWHALAWVLNAEDRLNSRIRGDE